MSYLSPLIKILSLKRIINSEQLLPNSPKLCVLRTHKYKHIKSFPFQKPNIPFQTRKLSALHRRFLKHLFKSVLGDVLPVFFGYI